MRVCTKSRGVLRTFVGTSPTFDSGDHLHPQDAGYKAIADSIDLKTLTAQR